MGYFDPIKLDTGSFSKPGMRGHPYLEATQALLLEVLYDVDLEAVTSALDLTAQGGALALALSGRGISVAVSESSCAAASALERIIPELKTFDGDLEVGADLVSLILPADKGNAIVRELLRLALKHTHPGGRCLIAGDKDRGFERYFKEARTNFGHGEILERSKGLRVALLTKTGPEQHLETGSENIEADEIEPEKLPENLPERNLTEHVPNHPESESFSLEARGQRLECLALPGVFSSGKFDLASKLLLEHLPNGNGKTVLDIGCGYGLLGGFMALEGANVTMLEDDSRSVESSKRTLELNRLSGRVLWSDVDSKLEKNARFDLIITNPPFHVGSDLILDVALEFIRAIERHLAPGGQAWLVANHFLPYERELGRIGPVREVAKAKGFKVLMVQRAGA
jgi:16S rRNA (guanine1207-N2)-methyltransferase